MIEAKVFYSRLAIFVANPTHNGADGEAYDEQKEHDFSFYILIAQRARQCLKGLQLFAAFADANLVMVSSEFRFTVRLFASLGG